MIKLDEFTTTVDLVSEKTAVTTFIKKYWNINDPARLDSIVDTVVDFVSETFKDSCYQYIGNQFHDIREQRESNIKQGLLEDKTIVGGYKSVSSILDASYYDDLSNLFTGIWFGMSYYNEAMEKTTGYYDRDFVRELKIKHTFKPKGYAKFIKDYNDYSGMDSIDEKALCAEFDGHSVRCGSASSFPLPVRIQLAHVAYDHIAQGRSPSYMLVATILSHFIGIVIYNNTVELLNEVKALDLMTPVSVNNFSKPTTKWLSKIWNHVPDAWQNGIALTEVQITTMLSGKLENMYKTKEEIEEEKRVRFNQLMDEVLKGTE